MVLIQSFATKNPCYKTNKKIKVEGIIIEGVGCPQSSARVFAHNRNRENCEGKCAHAFVDANDGTVIQLLPWDHRGWHCGKHPRTKKNANDTHIGIQLCEPSQIRYKKKNEIELVGDRDKATYAVGKAYNGAVALCAMLCEKFNLDPMTAVISRKEAYDASIASMQASPEFVWEAVGVDCTMDKLRADVKAAMNKAESEPTPILNDADFCSTNEPNEIHVEEKVADTLIETGLSNPEPVVNTINFRGVQVETPGPDYPGHPGDPGNAGEEPKLQMVKITVDNLRIRSTPGIGNNATGKFTGRGTFAITEIQNGNGSKAGWGKLQNGAGWICLDYVEML